MTTTLTFAITMLGCALIVFVALRQVANTLAKFANALNEQLRLNDNSRNIMDMKCAGEITEAIAKHAESYAAVTQDVAHDLANDIRD